mgnify:CR=1 FL=1
MNYIRDDFSIKCLGHISTEKFNKLLFLHLKKK